MRLTKVAVATLGLSLSLTLLAQQDQNSKTMDSPTEKDRFERAHDGMLANKPDKAVEAGRLTQAVVGSLPLSNAAFSKVPRKNLIDEHIFGRIERDRIPHAPLATDEEFLRRSYLDLTGVLPKLEVIQQFVANKDPQKRDKLIDSLVGTDEFTEQWAWFYGDLFQNEDQSTYWWMKQWLKVDRPYNETFQEIVTVTSKNYQMLPASRFHDPGMYVGNRNIPDNPDDYRLTNRLDFVDQATVNLGRIFLGINTDCISCHDGAGHLEPVNLYLSERKREEFFRNAAFLGNFRYLSSVNRGFAASLDDSIIDDEGTGYNAVKDTPYYTPAENRFPRPKKTYEPTFILTGEKPQPGENPRKALARIWPTNIQFSRAAVNLIWTRLMVVGFVEPYDGFDMARLDPKNPPPKPWTIQPTNSELLDALAVDFRGNNFSLHRLIKMIMKSNAYQLSAQFPGEWKDDYSPYYSRRFVRVLRGAEVIDAVSEVTGRPFQFGGGDENEEKITRVKQLGLPTDVRKVPKEGNAIYGIMAAFFQSPREAPPAPGNQVTPVQAMLMMGSPVINSRVDATKGGRLQKLLESGKNDSQLVEELFLAALARKPMPTELSVALQLMEKDRKRGAEKIEWALLNNTEFLLNH